jgi:hypothetical protein
VVEKKSFTDSNGRKFIRSKIKDKRNQGIRTGTENNIFDKRYDLNESSDFLIIL